MGADSTWGRVGNGVCSRQHDHIDERTGALPAPALRLTAGVRRAALILIWKKEEGETDIYLRKKIKEGGRQERDRPKEKSKTKRPTEAPQPVCLLFIYELQSFIPSRSMPRLSCGPATADPTLVVALPSYLARGHVQPPRPLLQPLLALLRLALVPALVPVVVRERRNEPGCRNVSSHTNTQQPATHHAQKQNKRTGSGASACS